MSDTTILKVGTGPTILRATQGIPGPAGPPGAGGTPWVEDEFTATPAQVTFILSQAPIDAVSLTFHVNGVLYDDVTDFSISGTTITWLDTAFVMSAGDKIHIRYQ